MALASTEPTAPTNSDARKLEDTSINDAVNELLNIRNEREAKNAEWRQRADKVKGPLRAMGMTMGEVELYLDIEATRRAKEDDGGGEKAGKEKLVKKLNTISRMHEAVHGEKLNWLDIEDTAESFRTSVPAPRVSEETPEPQQQDA